MPLLRRHAVLTTSYPFLCATFHITTCVGRVAEQWRGAGVAGAYGSVHKGRWGLDRVVAIKILNRRINEDDDPEALETFRNECATLQAIRNPHLLVFFGAGMFDDGRAYMVGPLALPLCSATTRSLHVNQFASVILSSFVLGSLSVPL